MRVLVTGGAGFIGGNLVTALREAGHDVGVVDDLSTGSRAVVPRGLDLFELDVLDDRLPAVFAGFRPEAVVHLAAQVDVQRSIADPERDRAVNVEGTARVARAARAAGARLMLSASSAAVYGEPTAIPVAETAPKQPENPYGVSKLAAESALAEALGGSDVDFASMRFANVYGPGQGFTGEGGVVARFAAALAREEPIRIFGDGSQTRDLVYVGDVVRFMIAALSAPRPLAAPMPDGPAYNVSTGIQTSVSRLAELLAAAVGRSSLDARHEPSPPGDIAHSALDPAKAARVLRWRASTALDEGLAATWEWAATALRA